MKLTGFLTGDKQITTDVGKTQQNIVKTDVINRQIRSMVPGQTLHGEVVARNGSEVQIRLSEDLMLQAKLDQNMNLEVGKNMTFEVKNNGKALVLSPLFTNVATDANVLKALDMASLPLNGTTVNMTKQLMGAGLAIDRNTLQQVYREVNMFPEAQTSDIVSLHKMQMPVNAGNITQMESYRNLTHQLVKGMNDVLDAVPEMFSQMVEKGDTEGAVKLYQQLVTLIGEGLAEGETIAANQANGIISESGNLQEGTLASNTETRAAATVNMLDGETLVMGTEILSGVNQSAGDSQANPLYTALLQALKQQGEVPAEQAQTNQVQAEQMQANPVQEGQLQAEQPQAEQLQAGKSMNVTGETLVPGADTTVALQTAAEQTGVNLAKQLSVPLQDLITQLSASSDAKNLLGAIQKDVLKPLLETLKQQWTITPEQVADAEQVEGLYRRLDKQLKSLAQTMESANQTDAAAYKAVTNMTQNLDFLQQINQMYTYVQLPLRLQNGEAHGDLYVYTNKKHLAAKDGQISALLHLDMEHLGPVDVYVAMQNEKVNTKFYLQDDDMLDFISGHMDILTQRLQKRGYHCAFEMMVREQGEEAKSGIQSLLEQGNHVPLAEYAFDVRT